MDIATQSSSTSVYSRVSGALDRISWDIIALPMRVAAFSVFWRAGHVKLEDWGSTVELFQSEYRVPILPPEIAAYLATATELGASCLLLAGLATRLGTVALLGITAMIQLFVYPMAWPVHVQWLAFLFPLLARGAGRYSLDGLIARSLAGR